jgi:DNA polymerase-3 subunit delta'
VQAFDRVRQRGRLAHAYLFIGPPGIGKRLFAHELAKALLCESPPGSHLEACDKCPACVQVAAGTHPDFFIAERAEEKLEFTISVMRTVCQSLSLKPARGRGRVAILDDIDYLNEEAANCFLKTLEEPPPGSILILIGTSADLQLPTIVSRCQVVQFRPLPEAMVADLLRNQGVTDPVLVERLTRISAGSPGDALALADPALWDFRRTLIQGLTQSPCDSVALMQALTRFVEEAGKESAAQRRRAALVLRLLVQFLDAALVLSVGGTPHLAEPEDLRALETLIQRSDAELLLSVLERCLEADLHIDRRVQLVLLLEGLIDALGQKLK